LNRIKDKEKRQKTQEKIFLILQKDLDSVMFIYNKIDNFYIKERLSKEAIKHHLPSFTNSFFYKSIFALDSRNIINTLDELASIAPKEVLKYYGEIKDEIEDSLNKIVEKIENLKLKREKAKRTKDINMLKKIKEKSQNIKIEITQNEELFRAFLEHFNIDEFDFEDRELFEL